MGIVGGAIHDQTYGGPITGRRWKIYRPFVEDDWRILPSLTLNLGLAWDMTTPITEVHNRMADYIPARRNSFSSPAKTESADRRASICSGCIRTACRPHLESSGQRQDRASPGLWHLSRFIVEPGRAGPVAKSAQPRRVRSIPCDFLRRLRLPQLRTAPPWPGTRLAK